MDDVERIARVLCIRARLDPDSMTINAKDYRHFSPHSHEDVIAFEITPILAWERFVPDALALIWELKARPLSGVPELKSMLEDEVPEDFADKVQETVGDWYERNGLR